MSRRKQTSPPGLGPAGRRFWDEVTEQYTVDGSDRVLLAEICEALDTMAALKAVVKREGLTAESSQGIRTHPSLVELRQQRLVLARLLRLLDLPADLPAEVEGESEPVKPPPKRRSPRAHLRAVGGMA
jgi:phage terminase small subunit